MRKFHQLETVTISVKTSFTDVPVDFLVVDVLDQYESIYVLYAQRKVVKAQYMPDDTWDFSEPVDMLDQLETLGTFHKHIHYDLTP